MGMTSRRPLATPLSRVPGFPLSIISSRELSLPLPIPLSVPLPGSLFLCRSLILPLSISPFRGSRRLGGRMRYANEYAERFGLFFLFSEAAGGRKHGQRALPRSVIDVRMNIHTVSDDTKPDPFRPKKIRVDLVRSGQRVH